MSSGPRCLIGEAELPEGYWGGATRGCWGGAKAETADNPSWRGLTQRRGLRRVQQKCLESDRDNGSTQAHVSRSGV